MALTTQFSGITGRKVNRSLVPIINQQAQYLPQIYAQKDQQAYQDKMYDLEKQGLDLEASNIARNQQLTEQSIRNQKKQAKTSRTLGYLGLGVQGLSGLGSLYNATKAAEEPVKDIATEAVSQVWPSAVPGLLETAPKVAGGAIGVEGASSGLTDLANLLPTPIREIGSTLWDFGSSLYDNTIGAIFEGIFS